MKSLLFPSSSLISGFWLYQHFFPVSETDFPTISSIYSRSIILLHTENTKISHFSLLKVQQMQEHWHRFISQPPPFFDSSLSEKSPFCFALSTDTTVKLSYFKLPVLMLLSLVWGCKHWKFLLLKQQKPGSNASLLCVCFRLQRNCLLETLPLATSSLLTLSVVASQSSLSFSNSFFEQFVFWTKNTRL